MRKYMGVMAVMLRLSLKKVLLWFGALTMIRSSVFLYLTLKTGQEQAEPALEYYVEKSHFLGFFVLMLGGVILLLSLRFTGSGSRMGYTLSRMRLSPKELFLVGVGCDVGLLVMVWTWEFLFTAVLGRLYLHHIHGGNLTHQTFSLAMLRSACLHMQLPLKDPLLAVRNLLLIICIGIGTSGCSTAALYEEKSLLIVWIAPLSLLLLLLSASGAVEVIILLSVAAAAAVVCRQAMGREEP